MGPGDLGLTGSQARPSGTWTVSADGFDLMSSGTGLVNVLMSSAARFGKRKRGVEVLVQVGPGSKQVAPYPIALGDNMLLYRQHTHQSEAMQTPQEETRGWTAGHAKSATTRYRKSQSAREATLRNSSDM